MNWKKAPGVADSMRVMTMAILMVWNFDVKVMNDFGCSK